MGQAHLREFFAKVETREGFKPQTLTDNTYVNGEAFSSIPHSQARAVLSVSFTTATGEVGDKVVAYLEAQTDDDPAFGDPTSLREFELEIPVETNNGDHSAVLVVGQKLLPAKEYVRFRAKLEDANAGTTSARVGSLTVDLGGNIEDPFEAYDRDGYAIVSIADA